jgi:hypothetical protein
MIDLWILYGVLLVFALLLLANRVVPGTIMILLSLHQRRLISRAADSLPSSRRGASIEQVARRLGQCVPYRDVDVARACRLALRAVERVEA